MSAAGSRVGSARSGAPTWTEARRDANGGGPPRATRAPDGERASGVAAALGDARASGGGAVLGVQGEVSEALGTVEWKGQDAFGWSYVTVARRGGRTTISVLSARADAAAARAGEK